MSEEKKMTEVTSLDEVYKALGREKTNGLLVDVLTYRATVSGDDLRKAVENGAVCLEEYLDQNDRPEGLVAEILEARQNDPEYPSQGIRSWLESNRYDNLSDWMLSERDVTCADIAELCNVIWSEDGLWESGYTEREEIASELIDALEREDIEWGLEASDLAEQLREKLGLESVWVVAEDIGKIKLPQSLLIGDKGNPTGACWNLTASRHTFDAAWEYLDALAERENGETPPIFADGNYRADEDDVANSNLEWLCETQGTTLMDVLTPGSKAWGTPFAASLRQEISEASACQTSHPTVAVLRETTVAEQLALTAVDERGKNNRAGVMVESAMVGIYDPVYGCGGVLDMGNVWGNENRMRPFCVPAPMVAMAMLETPCAKHGEFARQNTVNSTYGLVSECWTDSKTSFVTGNDPRLDAAYKAAERMPAAPADKWEDYGYKVVQSSLEGGCATIYAQPREDGECFHMVAIGRLDGETWGVASGTLALSGEVDRANELLAAAGTSFDAASPQERMAALSQAAIDERHSPWEVVGSYGEALAAADKEMRDEVSWTELSENEAPAMEDLQMGRDRDDDGER